MLRRPMHLTGVSAAGMSGCLSLAWFHCLGGFRAGRSWHQQAPEFRSRWCGIKSTLVGRWRWSLPPIPRASSPVRWCYPRGWACWPISWVSFWTTWHSLSRRHSLQNWPPTWHHYQGRQVEWGAIFDHFWSCVIWISFATPDSRQCGGVKISGLIERWGRVGCVIARR